MSVYQGQNMREIVQEISKNSYPYSMISVLFLFSELVYAVCVCVHFGAINSGQ